jgi:hypothetical protein
VKMLRRERVAEEVVEQGPRCAVLVVVMGRKGISGAIVGHALRDANADVGANGHASAFERGQQGTLGHDAGAARLQTLPGALQDRDVPSLAG